MPNKPKSQTKTKEKARFINLPVWPSVQEEVHALKEAIGLRKDFVPGTSPLLLKAMAAFREKEGLRAA